VEQTGECSPPFTTTIGSHLARSTLSTNPYAPPKALVEDAGRPASAPPLWNPDGAAAWSLLLSPAFGAYLHMKNWQALGEPEKAASAKWWIAAVLAILGFTGLFWFSLPDGASRYAGIALFIGWYFGSARSQATYVRKRYGTTYPRRKWAKALFYAVLAIAAYVGIVCVVFLVLQALARS
jgi:hypothetical protein